MNEKMMQGLINAPKEKRYKHFISHACDYEEVWMHTQEDGLSLWADQVFAEPLLGRDVAIQMDVHDFIDEYADVEGIVHVFPNGKDAFDVPVSQLIADLNEELELLE